MRRKENSNRITMILLCLIVWLPVSVYAQSTRLLEVKKIYVSPMEQNLDKFILPKLVKWGYYEFTTKPELADAVLVGGSNVDAGEIVREINRGTYWDKYGSSTLITSTERQEKVTRASVTLVDVKSSSILWATAKDDYWSLSAAKPDVKYLGEKIAGQLEKDAKELLKRRDKR
jgi:hypothetical protein